MTTEYEPDYNSDWNSFGNFLKLSRSIHRKSLVKKNNSKCRILRQPSKVHQLFISSSASHSNMNNTSEKSKPHGNFHTSFEASTSISNTIVTESRLNPTNINSASILNSQDNSRQYHNVTSIFSTSNTNTIYVAASCLNTEPTPLSSQVNDSNCLSHSKTSIANNNTTPESKSMKMYKIKKLRFLSSGKFRNLSNKVQPHVSSLPSPKLQLPVDISSDVITDSTLFPQSELQSSVPLQSNKSCDISKTLEPSLSSANEPAQPERSTESTEKMRSLFPGPLVQVLNLRKPGIFCHSSNDIVFPVISPPALIQPTNSSDSSRFFLGSGHSVRTEQTHRSDSEHCPSLPALTKSHCGPIVRCSPGTPGGRSGQG